MLKILIVGCGKIADAHAEQISRIKNCEIVGVCDREELMAGQLAERFPVLAIFTDLKEALAHSAPDVVHITTPTQSHYPIAKQCLEHGCHIYVEKPFTLNHSEAKKLIAFAEMKGLKLTVGHNGQFTHAMRRMRLHVQNGYLGGAPVHMESYWGYALSGHYARALIADPYHWIRQLPGKLLQNIISHGLAKIVEFLDCENPTVIAKGYISPFLKNLGEKEIIDELRVYISDNKNTSAYFTFSTQMQPYLHQFRVYGPRNGLMIDEDQQIVIKLRGKRYKSYLEKFLHPLIYAKQYINNTTTNLKLFFNNDFHEDASKYYLIKSFYDAITNESNLPITYREILLTSHIMEEIFRQIYGKTNGD